MCIIHDVSSVILTASNLKLFTWLASQRTAHNGLSVWIKTAGMLSNDDGSGSET